MKKIEYIFIALGFVSLFLGIALNNTVLFLLGFFGICVGSIFNMINDSHIDYEDSDSDSDSESEEE